MVQELQPGDPRIIGPYRLLGQLGGGGMGRVYLGLSEGGRPVAVKVIRADLAADPDFRVRFRREVAAARKVNGLYTALVVDADPDAEAPWLATAYVAGPSLAEAVRNHGALPASTVLTLAAGLAESLAAIHDADLVHRDLKPSNVLLAEDGPRVIDFGISRAAEATSVTHAGLVIGSPGFLSPEQAQGHDVGPPTDVFSLGAVLAFAATGEPPFGEGPTAALVYRVVHDPAQLDHVPGQIRPLIERCLAKDPSQRPWARDVLAQAGTSQPVTGWLPEPISHAFTPYQVLASSAPAPQLPALGDLDASGLAQDSQTSATPPDANSTITGDRRPASLDDAADQLRPAPPLDGPGDQRNQRRDRARTLTLAGITVAALAASAAIGYALIGRSHVPVRTGAAAAAAAPVTSTSAVASSPSPRRSPDTAGLTRKGLSPSPSTELPQSSAPPAASPAPAGSQSSTKRPPSTPPSSRSPQVPQISSVATYQSGVLVYFDIHYTDPGNDAEGFGFVGVNGAGWAEENHPFTSPSYGIVGTDSISYPFNLACGSSQQYDSWVKAWIYDTAGTRSKPVVIHLVCTA
jgi:serine/threonine protein kinase